MDIEKKELIELAVMGLTFKAQELQEKIKAGEIYLEDKRNGGNKSPLSFEEIKDKVVMLKQQLYELNNFQSEFETARDLDIINVL